ncbi:MAG: hypothetical protein TQ37_06425, partial [Candidatus Synechococcus spongiarum 15L]
LLAQQRHQARLQTRKGAATMTMRQAGTSDLEAGHLAPTRGADRLSITLFQRSRAMTDSLLPG